MNIVLRLLSIAGMLLPFYVQAQPAASPARPQTDIPATQTPKNDSAFIEISGIGATNPDRTPFWLQTNQWGTVPVSGNGGGLRAGWSGTYYTSTDKSRFRLIGGIEAVENITQEARFLLPEAYGGFRLGKWELFAGRRKQQVGLADSTLGTGAYAMSGNAMPPFRIQLGVYDYANVPFTNGWLQFMGFYSESLFEKNRVLTPDLKLHQKQFYMRLGNPEGWLRLYGGFNHQAQWGGKSPYFHDANNPSNKQMPKAFSNYLNIIFGVRGAPSPDHHDSTNRIGNHLGSVDLGMEIKTYGANFFIYRQSVYEDGSLIRLNNIADGLNGVRIRKNNIYGSAFEIHEAVFEFLYTKSQGGPLWDPLNPKLLGRDNYFNNYQVRDGWSYLNRTIGTPFITPATETRHLGQDYVYGDAFTNNNRVWAAHIGLKGGLFNYLNWTIKASYSRNFGVYDMDHIWPEEGIPQFSGLLSLRRSTDRLGGISFGASLAVDYGDLYPVTYGAILSIRKRLSF